jgi:hypothetical protein
VVRGENHARERGVLAQLLVAGQGDHLHHVKVGRFAVDVVEAVGEAGRKVGVLGGAAGALQPKRLLQGHPHRLLEVWKNFFFANTLQVFRKSM